MNKYFYLSPATDPDEWQRICDKADRKEEIEESGETFHYYNAREDD